MTDTNKVMHPRHFWRDPTDVRIRINPKIWIRIPDHLWFKFWRWQRFALSECSCYNLYSANKDVRLLVLSRRTSFQLHITSTAYRWSTLQVRGGVWQRCVCLPVWTTRSRRRDVSPVERRRLRRFRRITAELGHVTEHRPRLPAHQHTHTHTYVSTIT